MITLKIDDIPSSNNKYIGRDAKWAYQDEKKKWAWLIKAAAAPVKPADIHHVDSIGRGRDRTQYDDSKHKKMALCREHHSEAHNIGVDTFNEKYHVFGVIYREENK